MQSEDQPTRMHLYHYLRYSGVLDVSVALFAQTDH